MLLASLPAHNGFQKMNDFGSQSGARFGTQNGNQKRYDSGTLVLQTNPDQVGHFEAESFHFNIVNLWSGLAP